ncbi:type VI secretion protein [Streptomyces sp. BBFR109]|uniref:type VI secretion protein n=1 Tax=Streptomyces sp. BBFR109 TaxID=3448172 RepID=UPI003F75FCB4
MRPDDRGQGGGRRDGQGGIPDGLLIGLLAFLLGMTVLVWTATGLAGLFSHGSWPHAVSFTRTPLAMRHLVAEPHDVPGAWPDTPPAALSGYGLFWGLFIGQLMVLFVLTVFVLGTVTRWRAGRARRRAEVAAARQGAPAPGHGTLPEPHEPPAHHEVPGQRTAAVPAPAQDPFPALQQPAPARPPAPETPVREAPVREGLAQEAHVREPHVREPHVQEALTAGAEPPPVPSPDFLEPPRPTVVVAPREGRHAPAAQAIRDAAGPALVVTSNPALWQDTKDSRAKLGPVLLYDPTHLCDTPARLHWSPTAGCEDKRTALARATALLAPVRPTAKIDQAVAETAETLLRSFLHAAAIDGRTIRHVHRWSQGTQLQDAVRTLRTNPKAAAGSAGELEAALTAHPERRDIAQELTSRALASLFTVNVREACTPHRTDALTLDSFVNEGGTLYVVGESIEDPRTNPGAMPLLTALAASVVEHGRRMAERSSSGRLDPPLALVLDDVAAVAPLPQLPELLARGADQGLPTLALLRSREQGRARWPHDELPA